MKTDIYKIKTDQAWNRLYNRLDNDRLLAKVDEGRSIRKHSQWQRKPPYYIRSILLLINGK